MWTKANIINFLAALEGDPCINEILGEDATAGEELVIALEVIENGIE